MERGLTLVAAFGIEAVHPLLPSGRNLDALIPFGYAIATMKILPLQLPAFSHSLHNKRFSFTIGVSLWCVWKA